MILPHGIKTPNTRTLLAAGLVGLLAAGGIVADGLAVRARSSQELVKWTQAQAVPTVALAMLSPGDAQQELILPGTIEPYNKAAIYARVSGYLKSWQQDIGAHVTAGQVLATIDTPDLDQQLAQAKADLATATANAQLAGVTAQRTNSLLNARWVSQQAADNSNGSAAATKAARDAASANVKRLEAMASFKNIIAPFDGTVTTRNTDIGTLITAGNAGQQLFEISDLHRVRIYVQVPQALSAQIHAGLKATFELPQYPGRKFDAVVTTTSNSMNANSRSMLVELQTENAGGLLSAGAYCQVDFQLPSNPNTLHVPATALITGNGEAQVAILGADGKAALKPVRLGRDFGDSVEIVAGLSPTDRVIDSPPETLQTGDQVQLAATPPSATTAKAVSLPPTAG
jgi:RND family efflux transporter MFP subunit